MTAMAPAVPSLKPLVLVVDDETLIRLSLSAIVEQAGFRPLAACDAKEAIRILESHDDVRAVLTDVHMPGTMDGIGLIQVVISRWPAIVPFVTSGNTSIADSLPIGVQFIPKPFVPSQIEATLRQLIVLE